MKFKKVLTVLMVTSITLSLAGCSSANKSSSEENKQEAKQPADYVLGVSLNNPIKVDKEAGTVTVLTKINGKYFNENTRHNSVEQSGTNGAKSIFTTFVKPEDFYNALVEIGAKPGDNMTPNNAETTHVEGSEIQATVAWADKKYDINEVVKDSNGKKIEFHFGGNLENAKKKNTGCLSCLDSCPVGIVSNSTYTYGAIEKRKEVKFTGNEETLPEDGTYVAIIYSLKK